MSAQQAIDSPRPVDPRPAAGPSLRIRARTAAAELASASDVVTFAHRPRGYDHVYVGPLTPSGRFVPHGHRTVCGTRTRRLSVDGPVPVNVVARRMCRRCTCLLLGKSRRVQLPTRREECVAEFAGLTAWDLAVDAFMAETEPEVERLEWLALVMVGFPACQRDPITAPTGKVSPPLDIHISRARIRVGAQRDTEGGRRLQILIAENQEIRKRERKEVWDDRERRIADIGYINAVGR